MLFNSYSFIFLFLPVSLLGVFLLGFISKIEDVKCHKLWITVMSMLFYSWWNSKFLLLLILSITFNYIISRYIVSKTLVQAKRILLISGIIFNLGLISYYKYSPFLLGNINVLVGKSYPVSNIILPLGISFFTFQQIGYLIDCYKGRTENHSFLSYILFISFFPQLIAGPIVQHKEIIPQFRKISAKIGSNYLALGITLFTFGLFKKVVLADSIAIYSDLLFSASENHVSLSFFEAWGAALSYTYQLYFDFSGYSDMAIGLGYMFGICLPINFNSPYKATSIIDFWRRWHITLSNFLRDYLYIPLGGNQKGQLRRYFNLMITMLLGGLWHGAGWNFILWGGLHGSYLMVNHFFIWIKSKKRKPINHSSNHTFFGRSITFLAVAFAWVLFRAETLNSSWSILSSMMKFSELFSFLYHSVIMKLGVSLNLSISQGNTAMNYLVLPNEIISSPMNFIIILCLLSSIAWWAPNSSEIIKDYPIFNQDNKFNYQDKKSSLFHFSFTPIWSLLVCALFVYSILNMSTNSQFLYFNF